MHDMLVKLYDLPEINLPIQQLKDQRITLRRAMAFEKHVVVKWVEYLFTKAWASECDVSFSHSPIACFIATRAEKLLGFACYHSTCKNFFGPTGVAKENQELGIGTALLLACLHSMAAEGYAYAIIGGVKDGDFYTRVTGAAEIKGSSPGIYPEQPLKANLLSRQSISPKYKEKIMTSKNDKVKQAIKKTDFRVRIGQDSLNAQLLDTESGIKGKPTLVFLHEGLGSIPQWKDFPLALCSATGCPGFLYERFGYGNSYPFSNTGPESGLTPDYSTTPSPGSNPDSPYSDHWPLEYLEKEASTLDEILHQCKVKNPVLIGHSDGGTIALLCAANHSTKLKGVITEAAHIFVEDVTVKGISQVVTAYEKGNLKEKLARYHGERTDNVFWRWAKRWLDPCFRSWNIKDSLAMITCPLLVIQGREDEYATIAQVEGIKSQVSGSVEVKIIDGCRHVPHLQATKMVIKEMADFIHKISA